MSRTYTSLRFKTPVSVGGLEIDRWTSKHGQTNELMSKIRVEDVDGTWLALTWSGANPPAVIEVRWDNVSQRGWETSETKAKDGKK